MKITIVGTGYVGLVTGTCFAEMGHQVICVDSDERKIADLKNGIIPIWEPGLEEMVHRNSSEGRLHFSKDISSPVADSEIVFIAVGTPPGEDGSADLSYVLSVAKDIAQHMQGYLIIVDKSTVPVGTGDLVKQVVSDVLSERAVSIPFDIVSNPEFLKEGAAIDDFMKPDRVVIGLESEKADRIMRQLYAPFNMSSARVLSMSIRSAEMTKYAANALLATKISFINEIALICEKLGADVSEVRKGIGSDTRIGYSFIYPGVGYGGSCFPKDVKALIHMASAAGINTHVISSVEIRNEKQKEVLFEKVISHYGNDLSNKVIAIWGLSFKPMTDDMREAPSITIIKSLMRSGAKIVAYDPVARDEAKRLFKGVDGITILDSQYEVLRDADALLLITEWHQFRTPDFAKMKQLMKTPLVFDGRNQYDPSMIRENGFTYFSIGRK